MTYLCHICTNVEMSVLVNIYVKPPTHVITVGLGAVCVIVLILLLTIYLFPFFFFTYRTSICGILIIKTACYFPIIKCRNIMT